jgi:Uma2 family endonuclease
MAPAVLEPPRRVAKPPTPLVNSEALFEVVNGQRVELPNMSSFSNQIAQWIYQAIYRHLLQTESGTVLLEILFGIPTKDDPDKQRRPDVAYLNKGRWPIDRIAPDSDPWPAVPNLAVEVISPSDRIVEVNTKIKDYFEAGVELVWVVHPRNEMVEVYTAPLTAKKLGKNETLTAEPLLPGFQLPLSQLFRS